MVGSHDIHDCDSQGYITTLCFAYDKSLPSLCTFANDVRSVPILLAPMHCVQAEFVALTSCSYTRQKMRIDSRAFHQGSYRF